MTSARNLFFGILLVFLVVKLAFLGHPLGWDEAVYVGMGKFIYSDGAVGLWEDIRPLGLPLVIGWLWVLVPYAYLWLSSFVVLLFAVGVLALTYKIGRSYGLLAAALLMLSPIFFSSSSEVMSSIPAAFFSLLAVYLYLEKKDLPFVGMSAGVAFLFRFPQGLTLVALAMLVFVRNKSKLSHLFAGFALVAVPFLVFNYVSYADITGSVLDATLRPFLFAAQHQANPFHAGSVLFYPLQLLFQYALLAFAVIGVFVRKARPFAVLAGLYLVYYTLIPNKQERFLLDFLPYVCLLAAVGLMKAYQIVRFSRTARAAFVVFCVIATVPTLWVDYSSLGGYEDELVPFFSSLSGTILTMDPRPVAYSDALFIPMYDNPTVALETYSIWKDKVEYVLYFSDYYPCVDDSCMRQKEELVALLDEHPVVALKEVGGQEYVLYRVG